ncbi:MAG: hypothetical protein Edafosvirus2_52 [Edafosvirus sp.]|uniref:Uncharacterized protein n=1 Tax=Edafosvirus sp. TaxID=2487765 RepID=A0A3G4ZW84_9VIRU|nr:MAG: hypothetical protein Edafosvirus2_52 [Edafosvirus sp.]
MAFLSNVGSLSVLKDRLINNQKDIGNVITYIYGEQYGDKITNLLTQHILLAVGVLTGSRFL